MALLELHHVRGKSQFLIGSLSLRTIRPGGYTELQSEIKSLEKQDGFFSFFPLGYYATLKRDKTFHIPWTSNLEAL